MENLTKFTHTYLLEIKLRKQWIQERSQSTRQKQPIINTGLNEPPQNLEGLILYKTSEMKQNVKPVWDFQCFWLAQGSLH